MANHVFISYSRTDQSYARKLADDLLRRNFEVWIDDRIDYGSRWWRTIVKAIHNCAAFVVVMSPEAEESDWVEKEIMLAQEKKKLIFPLLLRGERFTLLINSHYLDVTGGQLPPRKFYNQLPTAARTVSTSPPKASQTKKSGASGLSGASVYRQFRQQPAPKTAANRIVCSKCGLSFNRQEDLDTHLRNWHASEAGQRSKATPASSPNILQKISQTFRQFGQDELVCPECGLPFNRQEDLDSHLLNWHSPGTETRLRSARSPSGAKPRKKSPPAASTFQKESLLISDNWRDRIKTLARSKNPDDLLDCPLCDATVKARNLVKHFDKTHSQAGGTQKQQELREQIKAFASSSHADDLLACPVCGTGVKAKNLVQHFDRTHT